MNVQFSTSFLDQLRARIDLSNIIARRTKLSRHGKMFRGRCPFHNEKTPSFYVYEDQGTYHCYGCAAHGDAITFTMHFEGYTFPEAVKLLADQAGIPLPQPDKPIIQKTDLTPLYECLEAATIWYQDQLVSHDHARQYLKTRLFNEAMIKQFRIGYAPPRNALMAHLLDQGFNHEILQGAGLIGTNDERQENYDRFRDRLMFPICNKLGKVVGFGGRILGTGEPKYLNSPENELFHKSHELYGHHLARKADMKTTPLIICEGYTDVIALHQAGYTGTVASLGTALTESQIELVWRLNPNPILCFDGDSAGQKAAVRAAERGLEVLKSGYTIDFVTLPSGDDPASLLEKNQLSTFTDLLSTKVGLADFLWQHATAGENSTSPDQKAILYNRLKGYAQQIKDFTLQKSYKDYFNNKFYELSGKAFNATRRPQSGKFNQAQDNQPLFTKRPCIDGLEHQQCILLSTLINHPELLHDVYEVFVQMEIEHKQMQCLRDDIIQYYNQHHALDVSMLRHHLYVNGHQELLDSFNFVISVHAPFAHESTDKTHALESWWSVWNLCQIQQNVDEETASLQNAFSQEMSPEIWQKIRQKKQDELIQKKQWLFES